MRELKNEVQRALFLAEDGDQIGPEALSETVRGKTTWGEVRREGKLNAVIAQVDRDMIIEALKRCGGNRTHAAQELGISRWGLVQKIRKYGIDG